MKRPEPLEQTFRKAVKFYQKGNLKKARKLLLDIRRRQPDIIDVLHLLSLIALKTNHAAEAVGYLEKAVLLEPKTTDLFSLLGSALENAGRAEDALAAFAKALAIDPGLAEVHFKMGNTQKNLGQGKDAIESYRRAVVADPGFADAYFNLGGVLKANGKLEDAAQAFRDAVRANPDDAEAHMTLGNTLDTLGDTAAALAALEKALQINPELVTAHYNLGNVLARAERWDDAIASYRQTLDLGSGSAEVHYNLGNVLGHAERWDDAIASYRQALDLDPGSVEIHINLGEALLMLGYSYDAVGHFRQALKVDPERAEVLNKLGHAFKELGLLVDAVTCFNKALDHKPDFVEAHSNLLLTLNYGSEITEVDILEESHNWNRQHASMLAETRDHTNNRSPDRRLKIGYVSPDMRTHSVSYFLEPLLANHDPAAVETFCYAEVTAPDTTTHRLEALADHWRWTAGMDDAAVAKTICTDGIDILVDLAGHTPGNRLLVFARRPAPVQVTWLGYPNTTGLEAMDYQIVDQVTDPGDAPTETKVRLSNCFLCYRPPDNAPPVAPSRTAGPLTFGSFNNITKVTEQCVELWSRVLAAVPDARLLMKSHQLTSAGAQEAFRNRFAARGVAPEQLELRASLSSLELHLGLYADVDVCLDPFPYNGTTTTCEALWMGVPVVTLLGASHRSRVGASLLSRVGLDDCVAADADAYVAIAAELARNSSRRAELRTGLRDRMAPFCDADSFARDMEVAYRSMWADWCAQPKKSHDVK